MSAKQAAFDITMAGLKRFVSIFGHKNANLLAMRAAEALVPVVNVPVNDGILKFLAPGWTALKRAEELFTQEPDTIHWINGFEKDSVFYDIGANVGMYSLYAAYKAESRVFAFEPAAPNYFVLNRNIELNQLDERISALCLAFNDEARIDYLYMRDTGFGQAMHNFGEPVEHRLETTIQASFKQGMVGLTLDDFVDRLGGPVPRYMKIDVDGIEDKIILGAERTLANPKLQSVLVEISLDNQEYLALVIEKMKNAGLSVPAQPPEASQRNKIVNYIFWRST